MLLQLGWEKAVSMAGGFKDWSEDGQSHLHLIRGKAARSNPI
jgi:hypothetical protein